jgi:hypothetical protein
MKHFFCLLLVVFFNVANGQVKFRNAYFVNTSFVTGSPATACNDGGFIVAGDTSIGLTSCIYLLKTDANGIPEQSRYFTGATGYPHLIEKTSDGGYVVKGHGFPISSIAGQFFKVDSSLNYEWGKVPSYGNTEYGSIKELSDGSLIIVYFKTVSKLDVSGNVVWSKRLILNQPDNFYLTDIVEASNGNLYITGQVDIYNNDDDVCHRRAVLIEFDTLGNINWTRSYGQFDQQEYYQMVSLLQTDDGGFLMAGKTKEGCSGLVSSVKLIRTDAMGTIVWAKTLSNTQSSYAVDATKFSDGKYLILCQQNPTFPSYNFSEFSSMSLLSIDDTGNIEMVINYNGGAISYFGGTVSPTDDGGVVIGARTGKVMLVKTDSTLSSGCYDALGSFQETADPSFGFDTLYPVVTSTDILEDFVLTGYTSNTMHYSCPFDDTDDIPIGYTHFPPSGNLDIESIHLTVSPIPASASIVIERADDGSTYEFQVMTLSGKTVARFPIANARFEYIVDYLNEGFYLYRVWRNGVVIRNAKLVVQR